MKTLLRLNGVGCNHEERGSGVGPRFWRGGAGGDQCESPQLGGESLSVLAQRLRWIEALVALPNHPSTGSANDVS